MLVKHFRYILLLTSISLGANLKEDIAELTKDHTQFAFALYPTIDAADTNLVFSPYSISSCLAMVYLGARGDTESQIQKTLRLEVDRKNIAKASSALTQSLLPATNNATNYTLNIANAVWVDQGTFLLADFRYAIEEQFKAKLGKINFTMPEASCKTINDWISGQTQGKIPELLTPNDINALTRLVLTNAIYFQGQWTAPFATQSTQDWPFHPTPDTSINVKMLHQTLTTPYYENDLIQAIALPFTGSTNGGGTLACVVLFPKSADNFSAMFEELPQQFGLWLSSLVPKRVDLKLPKFTLSCRYDLNSPLKQLGMEDAFDANANFLGIDGLHNLFVSKVLHMAYFSLDEKGISASAATAVSMNVTAMPQEAPPVQMIADHPFLFFIVDVKSQEILFMGKIVQPGTG